MKNNKERVLIIYDSIDYFIPYMENGCIDVVRLYKKKSILLTFIKKIFLFFGWFNKSWYNDWIYEVSKYSKIIIFATKDYSVVRYIKKRSKANIIFWYWNPAFRMGIPKKELYGLANVWSFDPEDCKKYSLKFNTTFFFKNMVLPNTTIEYDLLFLGINKGRRDKLNRLNENFQNYLLNTYFHIVPDKNEKVDVKINPIPYIDYLMLLSKSKAILDIQPIGQSGLTLRPMESIFFKKKLITDNKGILHEDFYNSQNIFVLGVDNISNIRNFISSPYKEVDPDIVNKFDFNSWLTRFDSNG